MWRPACASSSRRWRPATTPKSMALELSAILRIGFVVYALCSIEMTVLLVGFDVFTRQRHLWWLLPTFGRAGSARAGAEDHHGRLGRLFPRLGRRNRVCRALRNLFATLCPSVRPSALSDVRELVLGR